MRKLRVVVYLEEPFVIRIDDPTNPSEFHYDGFCIDLLKEMAKALNFTYVSCFLFNLTFSKQLLNSTFS
jgi:hypothetical protein